ncbi:unnamed protein product [Prorocentrum cordatum]|uniref:SCP domain-containing protein n=1 Tax=Prorocentrum cordatum TaxID=2364126 RepID=A0ABN9XW89_9DINO|nr:unnamed protein product [Polarella glacialis]
MATRGGQDEQLLAGPDAALGAAPGAPGLESGGAEGEPRTWRLRARAVFAALVACAVLAAVAPVGPGAAVRALAHQARAAVQQVGPGALGSAVSLAASAEEYTEMLDAVNTERMKHGLSSLCYNDKLNKAAQAHSDAMRSSGKLSHCCGDSDGSSVDARVSQEGYNWRGTEVFENIAKDTRSLSSVMGSWLADSEAQANILKGGISHFGFAKSGDYWTQVFASPRGPEACIRAGGGADGHGGQCRDFVPAGESFWHDSDGHCYHCDWYAVGNRCKEHGHAYEKFGHTANTACCACGGGGGGCVDLVPDGMDVWYDSDGEHYHCDWYGAEGGTDWTGERLNRCTAYGDHSANGGLTASQACCVCGGGYTPAEGSPPAPAPPPPSGLDCGHHCENSGDCAPALFC